ncbi:MAG: hypothetical protein LBQ73_02825, partial [Tannerellaceae bacterium]|nr:hypothetical protein [Tannerellaceae bacterium]
CRPSAASGDTFPNGDTPQPPKGGVDTPRHKGDMYTPPLGGWGVGGLGGKMSSPRLYTYTVFVGIALPYKKN